MLPPLTLLALRRHTCLWCEKPLTDEHAYPTLYPVTLLTQLTEIGPHHIDCGRKHIEEALHSNKLIHQHAYISAIWVVKANTSSPSGRIIRMHDEDPDSTTLHLFSPLHIEFRHTTAFLPAARAKYFALATRPAAYEEIQNWMLPAVQAAQTSASQDEQHEIAVQIALLHKFFPPRPKAEPAAASPSSN